MSVVGVIEIGTTSVKTLVRSRDRDLDQETVVTRLGTGLDRTARLDPDAVTRTLEALVRFRQVTDHHRCSVIRAVATSACRDASDADDFLDRAAVALGVRPEILGGVEEGAWGFRGASAGLPGLPRPLLVIDIGGGSTELMYGTQDPEFTASIDVGAGRLLERELHHDPPRPEELTNAIGLVEDHVDDVMRACPELVTAPTLIGVGGTVKVAAAVELGLTHPRPEALHGFVFERAAVEDVFRTLATEPLGDRIHNPGLPADRAELIVGGCCVLVGIMRRLHAPALTVSTRGVLDGLAAQLLTEIR